MTDPVMRLLDALPSGRLDSTRAERIRARCHAALARRRPRTVSRARPKSLFWAPMIAGVGGLYLTEVVHQVLDMYGLL